MSCLKKCLGYYEYDALETKIEIYMRNQKYREAT